MGVIVNILYMRKSRLYNIVGIRFRILFLKFLVFLLFEVVLFFVELRKDISNEEVGVIICI